MFQWTARRLHRPNPGAILRVPPLLHPQPPIPVTLRPFPSVRPASSAVPTFMLLGKYIFVDNLELNSDFYLFALEGRCINL